MRPSVVRRVASYGRVMRALTRSTLDVGSMLVTLLLAVVKPVGIGARSEGGLGMFLGMI